MLSEITILLGIHNLHLQIMLSKISIVPGNHNVHLQITTLIPSATRNFQVWCCSAPGFGHEHTRMWRWARSTFPETFVQRRASKVISQQSRLSYLHPINRRWSDTWRAIEATPAHLKSNCGHASTLEEQLRSRQHTWKVIAATPAQFNNWRASAVTPALHS